MTPDLYNRRFSDVAATKGVPPETIYEHDLAGATLKVIQLFNKSVPCDQIGNHIGKRQNPVFGEDLENRLSSDAKHRLLELFDEAISKIDDVRKDVTRSFKINSEAIRLVILDGLEKSPANSRLYAKIHGLSFDAFNQVIVYSRKILQKKLQTIEGLG